MFERLFEDWLKPACLLCGLAVAAVLLVPIIAIEKVGKVILWIVND